MIFQTWIVKLNRVLCNILKYVVDVAYMSHLITPPQTNAHPLILYFFLTYRPGGVTADVFSISAKY